MLGRGDDQIRCSFCNKTQAQVRKLIAGPNNTYICDECVDVCSEIIEEELGYEENGQNWSPFSDVNLIKPVGPSIRILLFPSSTPKSLPAMIRL